MIALARPSRFGKLDHPATAVRQLHVNANYWDNNNYMAFRMAMNRSYGWLRELTIEGYYSTVQELFPRETDRCPTSLSSLDLRLSISKTTVRKDISLLVSVADFFGVKGIYIWIEQHTLFSSRLTSLSINWFLVENSRKYIVLVQLQRIELL